MNLLITIDPVGRSRAPNPDPKTGTWINVVAQPSDPDRSDLIAEIGGKPADVPDLYASEKYTVDTNHADFDGMMNQMTSTGDTVKQRVENSTQNSISPRAESRNEDGNVIHPMRCGSDKVGCNMP